MAKIVVPEKLLVFSRLLDAKKLLPFMAVIITKLQHPLSAAYPRHHEISPSPLHKDIKGVGGAEV